MKDAAKNMLALVFLVIAIVLTCAPLAFVAFVVYAAFHYIVKFW